MQLLNIGCGARFHPSWINIDLVSSSPAVQADDIRTGLPYPDSCFDACYSSHVIEHFTPEEARTLVAETFRVLKPQGVFRVVVPDLHGIVAQYLISLEQADAGADGAEANYEWVMLELYDQAVRHESTGEMGRYLARPDIPNKDFIQSRMGDVWPQKNANDRLSVWAKLRSKSPSWLVNRLRLTFARLAVSLIGGREARQAFEEGLFRQSGEVHRWMYDRFSLRRLLEQAGFADVRACRADESRIPDFNSYQLDVCDGKVRIPQSLFMEALEP